MTKNLLVTGGCGFIGSEFIHRACLKGYKVTCLDLMTYAGNQLNLEPLISEGKVELVIGDIADDKLIKKILEMRRIDSVVNFAAESHVDNSINSSDVFVRTNVLGTYRLLQTTKNYYEKLTDLEQKNNFRFVHISTDEVFGSLEGNEEKFTSNSNYKPNSPYSATKAASDHLVRAWYHTYNFPVITTNCSNNYGPRQNPEKLIPKVILNALNQTKIPIYGSGENIRDWIFVQDHVYGIFLAMEKGEIGKTYIFGGESELTNNQVATKICEVLDNVNPRIAGSYKNFIEHVEDRKGHDFRYAISNKQVNEELGFIPQFKFEDALEKTIKWYIKNYFEDNATYRIA